MQVSELAKGEDLPILIANLKLALREKAGVQEILEKIQNHDPEMMNVNHAVEVFECLLNQDSWVDGWSDVLKMVFAVLTKNANQLNAKQIGKFASSFKELPTCNRYKYFVNNKKSKLLILH